MDKHWYDHSLIPPAYHVKPAGAAVQHSIHEKQARIGELTQGFQHRFPGLTKEDEVLEAELRENRLALQHALEIAASPSVLPQPPPAGAAASASVLAFAAASLPASSTADPQPLGQQLLFPAARPSARKQVGYLFQAIDAMLQQVGGEHERVRIEAGQVVKAAREGKNVDAKKLLQRAEEQQQHDVSVPSLLCDLGDYASWCGLTAAAAASSEQVAISSATPVGDLAIGAFLHSVAPQPAASSNSTSALTIQTGSALSPIHSVPQTPSTPAPWTIDARFQANLATLKKFASNDANESSSLRQQQQPDTKNTKKGHTKLPTVLQELSVYLIGIHELARQEWTTCQERGDLLHLLTQRIATLIQSLLPLAQREVLKTVSEFKDSIHSLLEQQDATFQNERTEWAKINTRTSALLIQMKEELKKSNARIKELQEELERKKIECTETDRLQRVNKELSSQLLALREQISSATTWREEHVLQAETLHFQVKEAKEKQVKAERELHELQSLAAADKERYESSLLSLQTRFIELQIPDEMDEVVKREVRALMEQRAREAKEVKHGVTQSGSDNASVPSTPSPSASAGAHFETGVLETSHMKRHPSLVPEGDSSAESSELSSRPGDSESDVSASASASATSSRRSSRRSSRSGPSASAAPSSASHRSTSAKGDLSRGVSLLSPHGSGGGTVSGDDHSSHSASDDDGDVVHHSDHDPDDDARSVVSSASTMHSTATQQSQAPKPSAAAVQANNTAFAALLKNTRVEYTSSEVDTYVMTKKCRFYDLLITKKQRLKFIQLQAPPTEGSRKKHHSVTHIKLPGQIGPKDWLINFGWSVLKKRAEYDAVADCYQQSRQAFPEFFYQMLLMHETVKGVKSTFLTVTWSVLRSLIKYKNVSHIAALMVDLLEENITLDGLNFLMALQSAMAQTSVGIDYGQPKYGQIKWVCTLRTRYVNRLAFHDSGNAGTDVMKLLNDDIDAHSEGMSLAEIKQHHSSMLAQKSSSAPGGEHGRSSSSVLQAHQMKQLTKIDYSMYLRLAAKHYAKHWKQQVSNVKSHFKDLAAKHNKKGLNLALFTTFVRKLEPSLDTRHIQQLFTDATQFARGDGIRFDDFKAAGGLQLLVQDFSRTLYQSSDWGVVHGEKELLSCVEISWQRLRPTMQPLMELVNTERTLLASIFSERLKRLEAHVDSLRTSLLHNINSRRVRELLKAFRETIYEIYGFLRYREEFGAMIRIKNRYEHAEQLSRPLAPDQPLPSTIFAPTPGPNARYMNDEVNAMLFMIQRELLAFTQHEAIPDSELVHDREIS